MPGGRIFRNKLSADTMEIIINVKLQAMDLFNFLKRKELAEISALRKSLNDFQSIIDIDHAIAKRKVVLSFFVSKKKTELDAIIRAKTAEINALDLKLNEMVLAHKNHNNKLQKKTEPDPIHMEQTEKKMQGIETGKVIRRSEKNSVYYQNMQVKALQAMEQVVSQKYANLCYPSITGLGFNRNYA